MFTRVNINGYVANFTIKYIAVSVVNGTQHEIMRSFTNMK